tara:strand:+ start:86 stop:2008 length:1923 start_codon:yes stop_codon:yes gene_type:complete
MATERRDIALSIIADTKRYQQELAKIPNMTDKAVSQAALIAVKAQIKEENEKKRIRQKALNDRLREEAKAEKERVRIAERANREIEGSYRDQFSSIKGLSGAAFGGVAGDAFDLMEVLTGAGMGMAAVGAGLAALAIAPELVRGIHEFAAGARETAEALNHTFTAEQASKVIAYEASAAQLTREFNRMKLEGQILVSSVMLPFVQITAQMLSGINNILNSGTVLYFVDLYNAIGDSKDEFMDMLGPIGEVAVALARLPAAPVDMLMALGDAQADFSPMAAEILKVANALDETGKAAKRAGKVYHDENQDIGALFDERERKIDDARKAEEQAAKDKKAEEDAAYKASRDALKRELEDRKKLTAVLVAGFEEEAEAERQHQLFKAEQHQREMQAAEELKKKQDEAKEKLKENMLALADLQAVAVGAIATFSQMRFEETRDGATEAVANVDQLKGEIESLEATLETASATERREIQATINARQDDLDEAEHQAKQAKKRARSAFREMKGLRIAEALVNGAAAAVRAVAELGPVAGAIAATSIGIMTGVQVAQIKAQKPPKFHDGGMVQPDEVVSVLRRGEAVLNERAAQRLGKQAIQSLNRDEPLGAVNIYLGEDLLRSQRLTRSGRSGAHSAIGARSPYVGR